MAVCALATHSRWLISTLLDRLELLLFSGSSAIRSASGLSRRFLFPPPASSRSRPRLQCESRPLASAGLRARCGCRCCSCSSGNGCRSSCGSATARLLSSSALAPAARLDAWDDRRSRSSRNWRRRGGSVPRSGRLRTLAPPSARANDRSSRRRGYREESTKTRTTSVSGCAADGK